MYCVWGWHIIFFNPHIAQRHFFMMTVATLLLPSSKDSNFQFIVPVRWMARLMLLCHGSGLNSGLAIVFSLIDLDDINSLSCCPLLINRQGLARFSLVQIRWVVRNKFIHRLSRVRLVQFGFCESVLLYLRSFWSAIVFLYRKHHCVNSSESQLYHPIISRPL